MASEIKANKISPATDTDFTFGDSGDTFTVPSGATIVNSGTATGFGVILQVKQAVVTAATFSTASTSFVDVTGMTVTTDALSSTSNKLFVIVNAGLGGSNTNVDPAGRLHISAGTANPFLADADGDRTRSSARSYASTNDNMNNLVLSYLTPALGVTSAVTCKLEIRLGGTTSGTIYLNRMGSDGDTVINSRTASTITVMEIKG